MSTRAKRSPTQTMVGLVLLLVVPVITIGLGIWSYVDTSAFLDAAQHADGQIVGESRDFQHYYHQVYEFTDAKGIVYRKTSNVGYKFPFFLSSGSLDILYLPSDPNTSRINGFLTLWAGALAAGISTILFAVIGFFVLFGEPIRARRKRQDA